MPLCVIFSVQQSGDVGGLGVSKFAVQNSAGTSMSNTELNGVAAALGGLYSTFKTYAPNNMSFAVLNTASVVDEQSGALAMVQNIPTVSVQVGAASGNYAAGTGARLYWHTTTVKNRRLVRGATYLTPLQMGFLSSSGTVSPAIVSALTGAGTTYIGAITALTCIPGVWCRPKPKTAGNGLYAVISSASMQAKVASLRSRRS
jgi:hypothetical protein